MKDKVMFLEDEIVDLNQRIKLLERIVEEQRLRIKMLSIELNRKYWWQFWK